MASARELIARPLLPPPTRIHMPCRIRRLMSTAEKYVELGQERKTIDRLRAHCALIGPVTGEYRILVAAGV